MLIQYVHLQCQPAKETRINRIKYITFSNESVLLYTILRLTVKILKLEHNQTAVCCSEYHNSIKAGLNFQGRIFVVNGNFTGKNDYFLLH
jgi:hypothetical protein